MTEKQSQEEIASPEVFISYSWGDAEYLQWVREFAEELQDNNIKVHLDQWLLREGDNKYLFMERMVSNPKITKVLILCDEKYKKKADDREGGVGTETTIITTEIYDEVKSAEGSQKFIPVLTQRDAETNSEFLPVFLKGRIYIDFSDDNHRAESMEQLIRTIYNKPQHTPPPLGKTPFYILEDSKTNLGTSSRQRRAIELIRNDKPQALNAVKEYFEIFAENLKEFDITNSDEVTTDLIIERIKETALIRDEFVELVETIARYSTNLGFYVAIHDFFESLIPYLEPSRNAGQYNTWQADHYKFFIHEIFLYSVSALLKHRRFVELNELTEQGYYVSDERGSRREGLQSFVIFDTYSEALSYYNERLPRKYYSIYGKFLKDRSSRNDIKFIDLMQADFFLFIVFYLQQNDEKPNWSRWIPDTLAYTENMQNPFEIFLRAQSKRFFEQFRVALGNITKEDFEKSITEMDKKTLPQWGGWLNPDPVVFAGISKIATRP